MHPQQSRKATRQIIGAIVLCIAAIIGAAITTGHITEGRGRSVSSSVMLPCQQYGVNFSGGEFGSASPGTYGTDYIYPGIDAEGFENAWELQYLHSKGMNLLRVGTMWERLQHDLNGPLTQFDMDLLDQLFDNAAALGMKIIIEPHNFARRTVNGTTYLIGSPQVPYAAFTDFWHKMAAHFAGHPALYAYSLVNEPHDTNGLWIGGGAQAGINGVRMGDTQANIIVPGDGWSGAWAWLDSGNDALKNLSDPSSKLIFEAHQYFDGDGSGSYAQSYDQQGAYPMLGVDRLQEFVGWLHDNGLKGILGEYGVPDDDPRWLTMLDNTLDYLDANSDVVTAGAYWSAGPWWGPYRLSVEPTGTWPNVTDRPQMGILVQHLGSTSGCSGGPTPTNTPDYCQTGFSDVPQGSTFYDFVQCLVCRDIISGYPDGTFRPSNTVTRGQLSKIVSNAAGYSEAHNSATFVDAPVGSTFHQFIERLYSRDIVGGYACGGLGEPCPGLYFRPNNNVTRGQTAKMVTLAAALPAPPANQRSFEDVAVNSTFWSWIESLADAGAIQGYECGGPGEPCVAPNNRPYFRPTNIVTRGQSAKIVSNTFFPNCVLRKK